MSKEIMVTTRTETGKGAMGRARKNGQVPAVLYGKGTENVMLYASVGELDSARLTKGEEVTLVLNGEKIAVYVAELQVNYMKSQIVHLDFCRA
ncbi:MAG: 50S ribosomal protein L25 [Lentisphaeria bacterium]|nr:50S ribosomal protein L25 [Lentisphaeria bacterium]